MIDVIAMGLYALTLSITPGPVNLLCFSIGVNFGLRAAWGFVSGATMGFSLLLYLIGLGLNQLLAGYTSWLLDGLSLLGAGFMIYLGVRIAAAKSALVVRNGQPPGFGSGFWLQWLNPKAWMACVAGISAFGLVQDAPQLRRFVLIYGLICYIGVGAWAWLGSHSRRWLATPTRLHVLNRGMGVLLILLSMYLVWLRLAAIFTQA